MFRMDTEHPRIKLGICGKGRAGKDTAAEFLSTVTKLRYSAGTSFWYKDKVFSWFKENRPGIYSDAMSCWEDRHSDRDLWARLIGEFNAEDPVSAYSECLLEQDFLVGMRWRSEFEEVKRAKIVDVWLWVENNRSSDKTCQIRAEDCDLVVLNNGTLDEYLTKLSAIAVLLARR